MIFSVCLKQNAVEIMANIKQTKQELLDHLYDNLNFLRLSASAFDAGHTSEAKRLAVTTRLLLHDTNRSKSLLGLLGWKQGVGYLDTAHDYNPNNLISHLGLVVFGGGSYIAPLDDRPNKFILFPKWWNKIIIVDKNKNQFNRRELILALANKDGGAHVDPKLSKAYSDLTRKNSVGWLLSDGTIDKPMVNIERFSMRQIAHEVIRSIERQLVKPRKARLTAHVLK